jgi:hypothetical protein
VAATAIVARRGAATVLSAELLAALGGATWPAVLAEHTWVLAVCWWRRGCGATTSTNSDDTRTSALPARGETAERVVGYLIAAVGLGCAVFRAWRAAEHTVMDGAGAGRAGARPRPRSHASRIYLTDELEYVLMGLEVRAVL